MKAFFVILMSALLFSLVFSTAEAASFDCVKAGTPRERLICATPQLSSDDSQLGDIYDFAIATSQPSDAVSIRKDERQWLSFLDRWCPLNKNDAITCLDTAYQRQMAHIQDKATRAAMLNMTSDPAKAEMIFQHYNTALAKLGLALDLRLLLPNAASHDREIGQLLNSIVPSSFQDDMTGYGSPDYDGSIESLVPYIVGESQNPDQTGIQLPLSCDLIMKFPVLLDGTIGGFGSTRDAVTPDVACDGRKWQPGPLIMQYESALWADNDADPDCGGTEVFGIKSGNIYTNWIVNLFPAALLDSAKYDGPNSMYLRHLRSILSAQISKIPTDPNEAPLEDWIYSGPYAYQSAPLLALFSAARVELETRYETLFGLSKPDAALAAQRGVWLIDDAEGWAKPGDVDPLAKAIFTKQPLNVIAKAATGVEPLDSGYLIDAVLNPPALALFLQKHPEVNAEDDDGLTPLMAAALYNQPASVKLLLAAGADVNGVEISDTVVDCDGDKPVSAAERSPANRQTALMLAAANAGLPVIQALIAAGADKGAKDGDGKIALDYFVARQRVPSAAPIMNATDAKIVQKILAP